ncbi:MAG: acyltransferase [Akkermansia sp.]|nr:acyltransferase [Akkermansia sp.]
MSLHMSSPVLSEQGKSYSIIFDYLRVFAMFGVLAVHVSQQFPMPHLMKQIAGMGAHCVQIFFAISGFLACSYFFRPGASIGEYYKKRALRILPTYYAAIVAVMVAVEFFTKFNTNDIFHLGWLRYFLGLNMILPSSDFGLWNNACGFWTMGDFIFFYAVIPFVMKKVKSFNSSFIFFLICFIVSAVAQTLSNEYAASSTYSELNLMIWCSPLVQMQHFALGMMTYFAVREGKQSFATILLICIALLPARICPPPLLYAILTCFFIISVKESDVNIGGFPRICLQFISKYSFHVYLTHVLAIKVGRQIAAMSCQPSTVCFYATKLFVFMVVTLLLCCFLELAQRTANKIFQSR